MRDVFDAGGLIRVAKRLSNLARVFREFSGIEEKALEGFQLGGVLHREIAFSGC